MATTKRASKVKPPKRVDRRKTTSTRITPETRAQLERASSQSGRSLAQEIEFRLEQSFRDEEARDREWGGKRLHGLFRMMLGVFQIAEEQTGKSCFEDWNTWIQVQAAWKRLSVKQGPPIPKERLDALVKATQAQNFMNLEPPDAQALMAVSEHLIQQGEDRLQEAIGENIAAAYLEDLSKKEG